MKKFGGKFENHCADWAAAANKWEQIRPRIPQYLELEQEQMAKEPEQVAKKLAAFLERPESEDALAASLRAGSMERTGAGLGASTLAQTGWSAAELESFRKICGATMQRLGYAMD